MPKSYTLEPFPPRLFTKCLNKSKKELTPGFNGKIDSVEYSAALAITGTWRGTSRQKLYAELGWESLSSRRWSRRLTLFFKILNNLAPDCTMEPIPQLYQFHYSLRKRDVVRRIIARTEKFKSSFYPHCLCEWNDIEPGP